MATQAPPGLFEGTARYYSQFRFGYPAEVFEFLVARFNLNVSTTVLDLGCGAGQIAIPLAQRNVAVRALDPEIEMLAEGMRVEELENGLGVAWQRGNDKEIERLHLPELRLCIMGASFHWTDRDALLTTLDRLIDPTGAVVVLDGGRGTWEGGSQDWNDIAREVIEEFLGPERRAAGGTYSHPVDRHEVVLARSAFSTVTSRTFTASKELTPEGIVGLQLSTSYASPGQLGPNIDAFKERLRNRLLESNPSGRFRGEISHEMLIGTRPVA